jgi:hypothetical protein
LRQPYGNGRDTQWLICRIVSGGHAYPHFTDATAFITYVNNLILLDIYLDAPKSRAAEQETKFD